MTGLQVVVRADGSASLGAGHVVRCLALAEALRGHGESVLFVSREQAGHCCDLIESQGFPVARLPESGTAAQHHDSQGSVSPFGVSWEQDAWETLGVIRGRRVRPDWLVVDHYSLDHQWEQRLRSEVGKILIIDDLANRRHECDLLLDQNYFAAPQTRYTGLLPSNARCLLGPKYAMLRREFSTVSASSQIPIGERLLVSVGAHDPFWICDMSLEAIRQIGMPIMGVEVITGADDGLRRRLAVSAVDMVAMKLHGYVRDTASVMRRCTMAIGAGGSSTWERCALGLPSLVAIVADNQRPMVHDLARLGVISSLGEASELTVAALADSIERLMSDRLVRESMRAKGIQLVDGNGVGRVVEEMSGVSTCTS
jgi:UDP-2,4-diacetamido-2,4,6-trideoxy-beta-L-altropyranose hydrolase